MDILDTYIYGSLLHRKDILILFGGFSLHYFFALILSFFSSHILLMFIALKCWSPKSGSRETTWCMLIGPAAKDSILLHA